jgi:glycosyltransferase involved in cell wall biosynthesis
VTEVFSDQGFMGHERRNAIAASTNATRSVEAPRLPRCWNVCVDHQPAHAGLYRGIRDFARALPGGILSFDGQLSESPSDPGVCRVVCGHNWLSRRCHTLTPAAIRAADAVAGEADVLAVHSLFRAHCRWAWQWAQRLRRPYWVVPHGCLDPAGFSRRNALKRIWMWRVGQRLFTDSDAVVFATRREMAKAASLLAGIGSQASGQSRRPRGVVIPWPVDVPSLVGVDVARTAVRARLGIPADDRILLWVGRFHETKRPLQAIKAFSKANPSGCHMAIVGLDETLTRADVMKAIPESLASRIHVLGELRGPALAEAWLAADGYISLSVKENFGYTAADALAYGLPLILSPGHDLAYELPGADEGKLAYGWLLPDNTAEAAVQAIQEWGDLGAGRGGMVSRSTEMRDSSRRWAADNLSPERFESVLRKLALGL